MVSIYDSLRNEDGDMVAGRTKLFISAVKEDGTIENFLSGYAIVPEAQGTLYIVDDYVIKQINKLQFIDGVLSVKDGEEIIPPVKSEKELQREALLKQLAELDSQPSE